MDDSSGHGIGVFGWFVDIFDFLLSGEEGEDATFDFIFGVFSFLIFESSHFLLQLFQLLLDSDKFVLEDERDADNRFLCRIGRIRSILQILMKLVAILGSYLVISWVNFELSQHQVDALLVVEPEGDALREFCHFETNGLVPLRSIFSERSHVHDLLIMYNLY